MSARDVIELIAVAINNDGGYCGDCDFEDGLGCSQCAQVCRSYGREVLAALKDAGYAVVPAARAQTVDDFVAQREEYVRVLRQCVNADADYHRWQGHAEARRQLRDKLAALGEPEAKEANDG